MIGFYGNNIITIYKSNYIKAEAASNILLQANWQETARCESIKLRPYLHNWQ